MIDDLMEDDLTKELVEIAKTKGTQAILIEAMKYMVIGAIPLLASIFASGTTNSREVWMFIIGVFISAFTGYMLWANKKNSHRNAKMLLTYERRERVYAQQAVTVGQEMSRLINSLYNQMERKLDNLKSAIANYGIVEYSYAVDSVVGTSLQFKEITGRMLEDLRGNATWFSDIVSEKDRVKADLHYKNWLNHSFLEEYFNVEIVDDDDNVHIVRIIALPLYNTRGDEEGFQIYFNDVTEIESMKTATEYYRIMVMDLQSQYVKDYAHRRALEKLMKKKGLKKNE